jgi:cytochrome c oxidase subunit I+III
VTVDSTISADEAAPHGVATGSRATGIPQGLLSQGQLLDITWRRPPGIWGWLTTTDHKEIGLRFISTAMIFFLLAGILALLMRIQLAVPGNHFLGPDQYNQFFTTHGTTMMFLFAVPVMQGMGIYLVPLMIGARAVSFPRLLNYSYWCFLIAGAALYLGLFTNTAPDMGWFSYLPLAGPGFSPGHRMDVWSQMVSLMEVSSLSAAIVLITTIFKQRAPGMSLNRMPIFVWTMLITAWMIIFAMPAVMLCSTMMSMDRLPHIGTHFYNSAEGGDPLLWQHLFWFFAHPEVYIIFLPATAFVSTMVETFSRRPIFGYTALILSAAATAFIGFGVWVHHMFATPLPQLGEGLFTASSLMIVIPNSVQMYCWIATIWSGKVELTVPMLFVFAFIAVFIIGGMTGVMLASVQLDLQVHDTMFVVAHLHYVLIGGAIFPLFGAFYYWFPKWTGRMLNSTLGVWNVILLFIGFNTTFWPLHLLGLHGMTRRVYTYRPESGWGPLNFVATIGAFIIGISVLLMLVNMVRSRRHGIVAGPNPWHSNTLEWATLSPPPAYNFKQILTVRSREPLWRDPPDTPVIKGLSLTTRQVLITTTIDAEPDHREDLASESIIPLLMALATGYFWLGGGIFNPWHAVWAACAGTIILFLWFWSSTRSKQRPQRRHNALTMT